MGKHLIGTGYGDGYEFDAIAKTITIIGFGELLKLDQIRGIINTDANVPIYSPITPGKGGSIVNNVLTLDYDTSSMNNTDRLQIWIEKNEQLHPTIVDLPEISKDTFGFVKTINPHTIFDNTFENHLQKDLWEEIFIGAGSSTYLPNESSLSLDVGTTSGDKAILVQHGYNQYLAGKSIKIGLTGNMVGFEPNRRFRSGYFDDFNGVFFEAVGNDLYVVVRSNTSGVPVDTRIHQKDPMKSTDGISVWNLDTFDGTGISGQSLDPTKHYLTNIQSGWQGGNVTLFGFDVGGKLYFLHRERHSNFKEKPFCERFSLPCRYEVENIGTCINPGSHIATCQTVQSLGGYDIAGYPFSGGTGVTSRTISTRQSIVTIRCSKIFGPGAKTPRGVIKPSSFDFLVQTNDVYWELVLQKGHLGEAQLGGTPTWQNRVRSMVEYSVDGTTVTGGEVIAEGFFKAGSGSNRETFSQKIQDIVHNISLNDAGTQSDYLHFVCTPVAGSATIRGSLSWTEFK